MRTRLSLLAVSFCLVLSPSAALAQSDAAAALQEASAALESAKAHGQRYLQSQVRSAQGDARRELERAEKLVRNLRCEECAVTLGSIHFSKAYFEISKDYTEALRYLGSAVTAYPNNAKLHFALGFSRFNAAQFPDAIRSLNTYLALSSGDPEREEYAHRLLKEAQQRFLSAWNLHANFYNSPESKITRFNTQTFQNETIFQVTPEYENQLGATSFQQLGVPGGELQDAEVRGYVEGVVQKIVDRTPGSPFRYQVHVVDNPAVNAVTMPGHIVVTTGLLRFARNESELASVLGHELGHNFGHHAARRMIKAYQAQAVTNAIISAINPQGNTTQLLTTIAGQVGVGLFVNAYNRTEELEADRYGAHLTFNAGYSPTALSSFLLRLYEVNPKQPMKWLSTHPPLPNRIEDLTGYLEAFPLDQETRLDTEAFQRIRTKLGGGRENMPLPPIP